MDKNISTIGHLLTLEVVKKGWLLRNCEITTLTSDTYTGNLLCIVIFRKCPSYCHCMDKVSSIQEVGYKYTETSPLWTL